MKYGFGLIIFMFRLSLRPIGKSPKRWDLYNTCSIVHECFPWRLWYCLTLQFFPSLMCHQLTSTVDLLKQPSNQQSMTFTCNSSDDLCLLCKMHACHFIFFSSYICMYDKRDYTRSMYTQYYFIIIFNAKLCTAILLILDTLMHFGGSSSHANRKSLPAHYF